MKDRTVVGTDKAEIDSLWSRIFSDTKKKFKYPDRKMKVLNFIRTSKPKSISAERWENISLTARYELYLREQKKELLKKQQELFDKLMKEAEDADGQTY